MNTTGCSWGLASGAINYSSGVAGGAVGYTNCSDAMVDGITEDLATSILATTLGGMGERAWTRVGEVVMYSDKRQLVVEWNGPP